MADALQSVRDGMKQVLAEQHASWHEVLGGLSPEALNWTPGPETNSITALVTHSLGAEESLLSTVVGQAVNRDRDAEFRAQSSDAAALARRVDEVGARTAALVDRLDAADLAEIRQPANDRLNRRFPGIWWLLHAVEHNREHIGQAMLTRQLYELRS